MLPAYVIRAPIFDGRLEVVGYRLIAEAQELNDLETGELAAPHPVLDDLVDVGLTKLVGTVKAWIALTPEELFAEVHRRVLPQAVVIQVPADAEWTFPVPVPTEEEIAAAVQAAAQALADAGPEEPVEAVEPEEPAEPLGLADLLAPIAKNNYTLALAGCTSAGDDKLLGTAKIVTVDVLAAPREQTLELIGALRKRGLKVLADNIPSWEDFDSYHDAGVDLFAGSFYTRPQLIEPELDADGHPVEQEIKENHLAAFAVMAALHGEDVRFDNLVELINNDPVIAAKVLEQVNSGSLELSREITSVQQAVVMLGIDGVRNLMIALSLLSLAGKPAELTRTALVRAHMCSELAGSANSGAAMTVGLLSTLDAFSDAPMRAAVKTMTLTSEVNSALLGAAGALTDTLRSVLAYEQAQVEPWPWRIGLPGTRDAYLRAIDWADERLKPLASTAKSRDRQAERAAQMAAQRAKSAARHGTGPAGKAVPPPRRTFSSSSLL